MGSMHTVRIKALQLLALMSTLGASASHGSAQNIQGLAARLVSKGTFDPGFNGSGFWIGTAAGDDALNDVVMEPLPSKRAVVCGHMTINNAWHNIIGRFNDNGSVDTTFGLGGLSWIASLNATTAAACTLDASGRTVVVIEEGVVGSTTTASLLVARLKSNGWPDETFVSGAGFTRITLSGASHVFPHDVRVSGDKIFVGGEIDNLVGPNEAFVLRLSATGTLDGGFNGSGVYRANMTFDDITIRGMDVDSTGRPVLVGGASGQTLVARLTTLGGLDNSFAGDGTRLYKSNAAEAVSQGRGVFASGNTVTAVYMLRYIPGLGQDPTRWFPAVVRLNGDGTNDTSFGASTLPAAPNPSATTIVGTLPATSIPHDIARSPVTGSITISATTQIGALPSLTLIRFNPNGGLANAFGTGGIQLPTGVSATVEPFALAVDSSDRTTTVGYYRP
jgi:uncharacterized delta-60 repeat protein